MRPLYRDGLHYGTYFVRLHPCEFYQATYKVVRWRRRGRRSGVEQSVGLTRQQRVTLLVCCVGTFMVLLDVSIVNTALPSIQRDLHATFSGLQWVVDAYTALVCGPAALSQGRSPTE